MPKYLLIQDAPEVNMAKTYFTEEFHNLKLIACTPSAVDGFRAANLDFICIGNLFEKSFFTPTYRLIPILGGGAILHNPWHIQF